MPKGARRMPRTRRDEHLDDRLADLVRFGRKFAHFPVGQRFHLCNYSARKHAMDEILRAQLTKSTGVEMLLKIGTEALSAWTTVMVMNIPNIAMNATEMKKLTF